MFQCLFKYYFFHWFIVQILAKNTLDSSIVSFCIFYTIQKEKNSFNYWQMIISFMWRVNILYFCLFYLHVNLYMLVDSVCSFEMFCRQVLRKSRCYVWFYLLNLPVMRYAKSLTNQKSSRGLIPVFPWVNVLFLNIFWEFDRIWPISVASQVMWFHWFFCFFCFL